MGSFNKFLKNKNTVTILGVLACLIILYAGYTMRINQEVSLSPVCFAVQTIQPKTNINAEMVNTIDFPTSFIRNGLDASYIANCNNVIGKYSNYNSIIAQGSIFYSELLIEEENLPDAMLFDVNEGERIVSFPVTMESTYGNSIMPGNKVDIYVKLINNENNREYKVVYGQFYEKVEILGVKTSDGKNVFESTDEVRTPSFVYFSLEEVKYLLFSSLQYIQEYYEDYEIEIVLVPNTVDFEEEIEKGETIATEVTSDYLYDFTLDRIKQIDEQKELYNELVNEMEQLELEKKKKEEETKKTDQKEE